MHFAMSGKGAVVARPCPRPAFHAISAPSCPGLRKSFSARPTPSQTRGPLPLARASPDTRDTPTVPLGGEEGYDVYVYEAEPLEEGVAKHTLSVFVGDEAGMINRVAGVFARRGANIESLAVGLTQDKALFTIVATGTEATVANLCKQLAKLVNVRYVEDITASEHFQRELFIAKVAAPPGATRTELQQVAEVFRARVVDVAERTLTLSATGDPGKIAALQRALGRFGIVELVRTGRIALKRGENLFTGPQVYRKRPAISNADAGEPVNVEASMDGDVYTSSGSGSAAHEGVWNVRNVLDAYYENEGSEFEPYTLLLEVQDRPGVLNQVTGVVARRGYNVQSLAVGNSEREGYSRITMVVPGNATGIEKLMKQVQKLVYVDRVTNLNANPFVARELMLIKVRATAAQRGELLNLAQIFHGSVLDVSLTTLTIEVTGKEDKMRALQSVLEPYGILEVARTGRISLVRDSGVDTKYLSSVAGNKVML
uniref:ACT domain-containing protein n=1 Tax=Auxenochlorella protothecoides TaxID=3075 RepID=A0A1D1ZYX2_AUXPR